VPFTGPIAAGLAEKLAAGPDRPRRIVDVAASHGMFGIELLRALPEARVVAVDWPAVLDVARENAARLGVGDRLEFRHGSAFDVDFGKDNDLVLLANFLHHFDEPTNTAFLKKVHASLRKGGQAIAVEFVPNSDRVSPDLAAFFSFEMLGSTPAGEAFTAAEFERMFGNAGFAEVEITPAPPSPEHFVAARA
jgi:ubiquinone/menaquinone biosynthesis C-methylase UbiE